MTNPKFRSKMQFSEDYVAQIKNATFDDAEDALMELCDYIEPWEDGDHWLELTADRTVSGKPVYFWFTADISGEGWCSPTMTGPTTTNQLHAVIKTNPF